MGGYVIKVSIDFNTESIYTDTRQLAEQVFHGLNVTLPMGYTIAMYSVVAGECVSIRNKWEDRRRHYAETR